jgi:hypothetical protein
VSPPATTACSGGPLAPLDAEALAKLQQRIETLQRTEAAAKEAIEQAKAGLERAAEEAAEKMLKDWPREILEPLVVELVKGLDWRLE